MKKLFFIVLACVVLILGNLPANAQFGKLLDKAKTVSNKAKEIAGSTGETTVTESSIKSTAEKKLAKTSIFFANKKFTSGTEGAKTEFEEGEYIYARLILPKPAKEYLDENGILSINLGHKQTSEGQFSGSFIQIDGASINKEATLLDFDVLPNPAEASTHFANYLQAPANIESAISSNSTNQKTEFLFELEELQGSFSLKVKSKKSFEEFVAPIRMKMKSIHDNDDAMKEELPAEFNEKSYAFKDPQINKQRILETLPDGCQMLKMVIGPGEDYTVVKNEFGAILHKQSIRYVYVAYKEKSTGFCYCVNVIFEREYEGNGKYGSLTSHNHGGRIDCSKIK